jgi:hypothetical protein
MDEKKSLKFCLFIIEKKDILYVILGIDRYRYRYIGIGIDLDFRKFAYIRTVRIFPIHLWALVYPAQPNRVVQSTDPGRPHPL